ncbi:MAG: ccmI [Gammaproteobacteria bacterium]|nr:ccmI [Gammaproteobacteria bacterium]
MILFWILIVIVTLAVLCALIYVARLSVKETVVFASFVFIISLSMYAIFGAYSQLSLYIDKKAHAQRIQKEIQALGGLDDMIQKMEERVHQNQDAKGWFLLGRLYMRAQRFQDAVHAFAQSNQREPNQPETLASYAEALDLASQQQATSLEARIKIPVRVTLSPALQGKLKGSETVFIYAKAAEGSNAPLAIIRVQVKDLPIHVVLDETMAMLPTATLQNVEKIKIVARISMSGEPAPAQGDLQGESAIIGLNALPDETHVVINGIL